MPAGLISFDAAGTLIRPAVPVEVTYSAFAAARGLDVEPAVLNGSFRKIWRQTPPPFFPEGQRSSDDDRSWWRQLVAHVFADALGKPLERELLDGLFSVLYDHYAEAEAWSVFPDVVPALDLLGQDYILCVLSNFDRRLCSILRGHDLLGRFRSVVLSSEVGAAKPHRRMFDEVQSRFAVAPERCLHVGDEPVNDVEGARNAGWAAWHVVRPAADLQAMAQKVREGAFSGLQHR